MNKPALLALALASFTCSSNGEYVVRADRPHDSASAAVAASPSARAWQRSLDLESASKFEAALAALEELPPAQRNSYATVYRRGWLLYRLGRYPDSANAYGLAASIEPQSIEARVGILAPLMSLEKWNDVAAAAEEVLKRDPENYLALQRLAFAKYSSQHFPEAESLYRHLVQTYPSDLDVRAALAWAALRMGKAKEAAALFTQVLDLNAHHASAASGLRAATTRPWAAH